MDIAGSLSNFIKLDIGDYLLYASIPVGIAALLLLLVEQFSSGTRSFEAQKKWLIRLFALLLTAAYGLLNYYFAFGNYAINYVWAFSSKGLPIYYKLAGTLAGQQGTLLFWAFLISIGALGLSGRGANKDFIDKSLIVVLLLGLYFVFLTQLDSPFKTIYAIAPDIPRDFVPPDGNGLNPLLIDPWMAIHPALMFFAYAATTNPFAVSVVYMFRRLRKQGGEGLKQLLPHVIFWCRISWLFLTLGVAVGGLWAYKVLGWGGFWAWDPVETSSLIPWLMLTGAMHALVEHRKDRKKYALLAPTLISMTFALVVYATLVTRSGFFESVHAFAAGGVGFYLVALAIFAFALPVVLSAANYLTIEEPEPKEEAHFINKTNIFYLSILGLVMLTFISFWGITFPALTKLFTGNKYGIGIAFFNIWSYPIVIGLLLFGALCFNYKSQTRGKSLAHFTFFTALTIIAALIKPNDAWNIVDYSAIINPEKPFLYTMVGSISALSVFPPCMYFIYSIAERGAERLKRLKGRDQKIVEVGILTLHASIILVFVGTVFSAMFDTDFSIAVSKGDKGKLARVEGTPFSIKLVDYDVTKQFLDEKDGASAKMEALPGMTISEFYDDLGVQLREEYTVRGEIAEVLNTEHNTYFRLTDAASSLWVAVDRIDVEVPPGTKLAATGFLLGGFESKALNRTFDVILFSNNYGSYDEPQAEVFSTTTSVNIAVYNGNAMLGEGDAKVIQYKNGDTKKVMIDRSWTGDVYVIFTGFSGEAVPLDVKIKPMINLMWLGIILFALSIIAITIFDRRYEVK